MAGHLRCGQLHAWALGLKDPAEQLLKVFRGFDLAAFENADRELRNIGCSGAHCPPDLRLHRWRHFHIALGPNKSQAPALGFSDRTLSQQLELVSGGALRGPSERLAVGNQQGDVSMPGNPAGAFGFRRLLIDGPLLEPLSRGVSKKQVAQRSILAAESQVR